MEFVHLHTHSEYSILDSTNTLDGLLNKAQEMNMEALALTDHGNIGGAVKFYKKAKERGIKPIIGCELYVAPGSRHDKKAEPNRASASPYYHLVVLAENNEGYRNLVTLSSRAHTEGFYYKPRVDRELLREHHRGLIALSACQSGEVPKALLQDDFEKAVQVADELHDLFGEGNFFIELQDQGVEGQRELNQDLRAVAEQLDLPLVATNDIHYLEKEDKLAHEVLLNIQANKKITDEDRRRYEGEEYYFKSAQEMENRFAEIPQALENTVSIAERCEVSLDFSSTYLPPFKIPDQFQGPGEYLRELVLEGAKERWGQIRPEIRDRLDHELDVIEEMGYPTYFLIVRDFINFARREGIPVGPGRGSAAASAVAYCLKITDVDPLEHGLLFERFLNPARVSMPDIDIDFCQEGRDKVINYVVDKYGEEQVAQIATFDTMAARSAIRDVARVLDIPYDLADTIAKTIPPRSSLSEALGRVDELQDIRELFPEQERRDQLRSALTKVDQLQEEYGNQGPIEILFEISMKLEGLMRNASTHAAGVVIAPDDLTDYTPLQRLSDEEIVTQFDMTDLEEIGLLKMDFLGLRNLTIIDRTFDLVEEKENRRLDLEQIPFEDESTFELLREGKTAGVFQLESTGMQGLLKRLEPEEFEDIIASNALYRPGPLESGMTDDYIERKHGRQETTYPYPELEPVLEETYGLPIYQEQIMKMAQTLAGFSLAEADTLRKAMGKKKRDVMAQMEQKFIDGCVQNGISRGNAEELFSDIDKFSRYGFNKAHSTAYAYISYWTAWLKANYSASYMASLLTSVGGNEDKVSKYVKECEEMGIRVLPPDVNESDRQFTPVGDDRIRFGLSAIKYVGKDTTREIIENRPEEGFPTFFDFCRSLSSRALNSEALESLIKVGALDCFGTRKYLLSRINEGLEVSNLLGNGKGSGQRSFFDQEANLNKSTKPREEMDEFSEGQLLRFEKELLGLFITGDPLQNHEQELNTFCNLDLCEVESLATGTRCWIGGRISDLSRVNTKNGKPMAFISIDDGTEEREIIVFPQVYEQYSSLLKEDNVLIGQVKIGKRNGDKQLIAGEFLNVDEAWDEVNLRLTVELPAPGISESLLERIEDLCDDDKGTATLFFKLVDTNSNRFMTMKAGNGHRLPVEEETLRRLESLEGVRQVQVEPEVD